MGWDRVGDKDWEEMRIRIGMGRGEDGNGIGWEGMRIRIGMGMGWR